MSSAINIHCKNTGHMILYESLGIKICPSTGHRARCRERVANKERNQIVISVKIAFLSSATGQFRESRELITTDMSCVAIVERIGEKSRSQGDNRVRPWLTYQTSIHFFTENKSKIFWPRWAASCGRDRSDPGASPSHKSKISNFGHPSTNP